MAEFPAIELLAGDCIAILPTLAENSIDACVTDPPYHLTSIVKRFGKQSLMSDQTMGNSENTPFKRTAKGFMGKQWDGGDVAFRPETWAEVYRVLKPGAHLLAFGGTRTYHRMACAIEDAGFEIRDCIQWLYGSGFPKSHDVSKGIDRAAGHWRGRAIGEAFETLPAKGMEYERADKGEPVTDAARQWEGWGTALKPACKPIVLARKPLSEKTIAANVLKWGTGAINVDGCRIEGASRSYGNQTVRTEGRWPANVIHDGSEEVLAGFPETQSGLLATHHSRGNKTKSVFGKYAHNEQNQDFGGDSGSAARFFYTTKADSDDRIGSKHPTVKPLDLMQYLVRLVTPKGGLVLDPFGGTGTTGEAAFREGMRALLIERDEQYQKDIRRRTSLCMAGPNERKREINKANQRGKPIDYGPLFAKSEWEEMWQKPFDKPELVWGKTNG